MALLMFFNTCFPLLAQPTPPHDAPINGLSLLIAGGVGYGVKKIREKRKKQEEVQKSCKVDFPNYQ